MAFANARKNLTAAQWTQLIGGLLVFLVVIVSAPMWTDYQAEQPIDEHYRHFLEQVASISWEAESSLDDYLARHQRITVASKDFAAVCVVMIREAKEQGARPEQISERMTRTCQQMGRGITEIP
jgi:hypothetical protein